MPMTKIWDYADELPPDESVHQMADSGGTLISQRTDRSFCRLVRWMDEDPGYNRPGWYPCLNGVYKENPRHRLCHVHLAWIQYNPRRPRSWWDRTRSRWGRKLSAIRSS